MSKLRKKWERADVENALILRFARVYHGEKYKFLTLSTRKDDGRSLRYRKKKFFGELRKYVPELEYRCVSTEEGYGVCHICLVTSRYLPQEWLKDLWGARVHITREKDGRLDALVNEMSLQTKKKGYSMSRNFLPDGARKGIEMLSRHFRGRLGFKAVEMLARRWNSPDAYNRTVECCSRKDGMCTDLKTRMVYLGGRNADS